MESSIPVGTRVRIAKDIYDHKRGQRFLAARAGEGGVVTSLGTRPSPLWQRVKLDSGKKLIVDFEDGEAVPVRKNHHIREGGEFYTPAGRKGTVLGSASKGSYPVRWKDGTFGRVRDTEKDAYPTEGSRAMKRKNPGVPCECGATDAVWRSFGTGLRRYLCDRCYARALKQQKNPASAHRIDTDREFDRRTGKRADAQKALARIKKANDRGFHLDHRGWYKQKKDSHLVEYWVGGSDADRMARGTRHRSYVDAQTAAVLNAFVAGKGGLP